MTALATRPLGWSIADAGNTELLTRSLDTVRDLGYQYAELDSAGWGIWIGGRLDTRRLARWASLVEPYADDLQFTLHASGAANPGHHDINENLLRAGVETARALGAVTLVIHPLRQSMHTVAHEPAVDLLARERDVIRRLADLARPAGPRLALETMTPPTRDAYSYAMWPWQLAEQVERIGDPNVGICIDSGHLFLSAQFGGFDFAEAVGRLAEHTIHTHVQDGLGIHDPRNSWLGIEPTGIGDAHLPPGAGRIPLGALASLPDGVPLLAELPRTSSLPMAADVYQYLTTLTQVSETV